MVLVLKLHFRICSLLTRYVQLSSVAHPLYLCYLAQCIPMMYIPFYSLEFRLMPDLFLAFVILSYEAWPLSITKCQTMSIILPMHYISSLSPGHPEKTTKDRFASLSTPFLFPVPLILKTSGSDSSLMTEAWRKELLHCWSSTTWMSLLQSTYICSELESCLSSLLCVVVDSEND